MLGDPEHDVISLLLIFVGVTLEVLLELTTVARTLES